MCYVVDTHSNLEIHDGIICATAILYYETEKDVNIITKYREIINSKLVKIAW